MKDTKYKEDYKEDLKGKSWLGVIVDTDDPLFIGRAKIRVFEKFDQRKPVSENGDYPDKPLTLKDMEDESNFVIPTAMLPWCFQVNSTVFGGGANPGSGSFSTPKIGSLVKVNFCNNDIYSGEYTVVHKPNEKMINLITTEEGDYVNATVTTFDEDEDMWVLYTKSIGLQVYHKGSQIVIRPDSSIFIEHKDTESMIELSGPDIRIVSERDIDVTSKNRVTVNSRIVKINGENTYIGEHPIYSSVNGEPLEKLLKAMAVIIDGKNAPTPGVCAAAVDAAMAGILSKSVKTSL